MEISPHDNPRFLGGVRVVANEFHHLSGGIHGLKWHLSHRITSPSYQPELYQL